MQSVLVPVLVLLSTLAMLTSALRDTDCACPVHYKPLGCYLDNGNRPLPDQIVNERDPSSKVYNGNLIDWSNWEFYMPSMVCRCANKAKELGYKFFAIQFWGECWAGKDETRYQSIGEAPESMCYDQFYKQCTKNEKHCVGEEKVNYVYEIEDTSCPVVPFERVGCFKDKHNNNSRPIPDYALTEREPALKNIYNGIEIDWHNMDYYLPQFACRCATKAKELGHRVFGLQYYGECFTGTESEFTYNLDSKSGNCVNRCYGKCLSADRYCVGTQFTNFVYRLTGSPCVNPFTAVGCLQEVPAARTMNELLLTEKDPGSAVFDGHLSKATGWNERFPEFVCSCALKAREKKYTFFSVTENGDCYSSSSDPSQSISLASGQCVKPDSTPCDYTTNSLCGGKQSSVFVYKLDRQ